MTATFEARRRSRQRPKLCPLEPQARASQEFAHHLTEQDPAIRKMLRLLINELPPNPQEIKRFINVYRFYAFIQYEREAAGLPAPPSKASRSSPCWRSVTRTC
jgi:hypothetical protein